MRACPIYLKGESTVVIAETITVRVKTPKILWDCLIDFEKEEGEDKVYRTPVKLIFERDTKK